MDDMNLVQLVQQFADDAKCRAYIQALRWPEEIACPRCKATKIYPIAERDQFMCDGCSYQFSATAGTIFHDSHLPLWKWFIAVYLMAESKKGMSANQLKRTLKVSYKTAWFLCHRIRKAMTEVNPAPLKGTVELDETYIGGKRHWKNRTYLRNKQMVLGAIERNGPIRLKMEKRSKNVSQQIAHEWIKEAVAPDAELPVRHQATRHESVDDRQHEYVRGNAHINSIENAWSLFKRSLIGSYHKVSAKHLDAYLDEFEWRFNNRKNPYLFRDTMLKLIASDKLEYKKLTETAA